MQRRIQRPLWRSNIKVFSVSLAAFAAVVVSLTEGARIQNFIDQGRGRISQMMRLEQMVWEEVGGSNLSARVTKESLWQASGLKLGQEMLPIDLAEIETRLSTVPWIESLQIQKKLPSTLFVRYTVHHARAVGLRKGKPWTIAVSGKWIAPLDRGAPLDLPVFANEETVPMQMLWLDALENELGASLIQVHDVNFSAEKARLSAFIELQYSSQSVKISLAATGRPTPETLTRLKRVVQYLIKNNVLVSGVDLRLGKKVVVNVGKRP